MSLSSDKEQYQSLLDVSWWSETALILARCSGALTVSSVRTLKNLLGKSCEWFEPSPRVTSAHDGGFLSLEVCVSTCISFNQCQILNIPDIFVMILVVV